MKTHSNLSWARVSAAMAVVALGASGLTAQQPGNSVAVQQEAMKKLAFLAGHWSGPATIARGPGEPLHLTQTENVEYKLDGLVLLIEGKSTGEDGKAQFEALATIAYDDAAQSYRFRAYNGGHYVDTELKAAPDGFRWGMDAGPAHIVNTMRLTAKGEWQETTEVTFGSNPPRQTVEMLLRKQ
ncbi:MAG TPA: hypothetical protein VL967_08635 [Terracidiphilus sp.]|nr:hypothetical protein [Terracidiphilus sp.]